MERSRRADGAVVYGDGGIENVQAPHPRFESGMRQPSRINLSYSPRILLRSFRQSPRALRLGARRRAGRCKPRSRNGSSTSRKRSGASSISSARRADHRQPSPRQLARAPCRAKRASVSCAPTRRGLGANLGNSCSRFSLARKAGDLRGIGAKRLWRSCALERIFAVEVQLLQRPRACGEVTANRPVRQAVQLQPKCRETGWSSRTMQHPAHRRQRAAARRPGKPA